MNKVVLNSAFHIPRRHIDMHHFDLKKPAIVIANHQSFVDILFGLNFSSKMLLQTKDWVWNNYFLRSIVRFSDSYPISYGYDQNLQLIKEKMTEGYSFMIYPEGSRSVDMEIKRFHKGAFFMAQELEADILPILFHGAGTIMPIKEPFLYSEPLRIKFLPRIDQKSSEYGLNYRERSKNIAKYMRTEFTNLSKEIETPAYYKRKLISRYIYKGPVLEWYCRIKLRLESNYAIFDRCLPKEGLIYDVGCGYGFISHMLKYTEPNRTIVGIDYDSDKIEIATHAEHEKNRPEFQTADVCTFDYNEADAFVISDVLHYLKKDKQIELLNTCLNKLKPGGILLVRDANSKVIKRHFGTRLTEIFSTKIFGFNKTLNNLEFVDETFFMNVFKNHNVDVQQLDNTKLTSNQLYIVTKNG